MAVKKKSLKGKGSYAEYKAKNSWAKNKVINLTKHCKNNPTDTKALESLALAKAGKLKYTRSNHAGGTLVDNQTKNKLDIKFLRTVKLYRKVVKPTSGINNLKTELVRVGLK